MENQNIITKDAILEKFPFDEPRPGQIEVISDIITAFNNNKKFVILEAPCGAGKSVIGMTVAKFFNNAYYLTIQKILQDQLVNEFGENGKFENLLTDLKGRNAYPCRYYKLNADKLLNSKAITKKQHFEYTSNYFNCAEGHCRKNGKYRYDDCLTNKICDYYTQRDKAVASNICLMNFASFLYQTNYTENFKRRSLLILDEGHNIETQLLDFISITITEKTFTNINIKLPILETPEEYAYWFEENDIVDHIIMEAKIAETKEDIKLSDELTSLGNRIGQFISIMNTDVHDEWIVEHSTGDHLGTKLIFKPIHVSSQAHKYLFDIADHILIMSATILNVNVMARSLGIDKTQLVAKRLGSRFPKENRPIYINPVAKVTGGKQNQKEWGPSLISEVNRLCNHYNNYKGIIHTHNFQIAQMLIDSCDKNISKRFLFQKNFNNNKSEMLKYHGKERNTIIIAPAMHEGVDLVGDLSRFQIVCKVPFPNFIEDKQLAARKELDPQFYDWLTALKLVQCVGRSIRNESDWADTYIIDASFKWWYNRNRNMLPQWFTETVQFI